MRTVLRGGLLVDPRGGRVRQGDLAVSGGRIVKDAPDAVSRDVSGCVVMPGLVCGHHHLYSTLARGMPSPRHVPQNFEEILRFVWWELDRSLDLETIRLSALMGTLEALRRGTTTIVDHHASPEAIDGSLDAVASGVMGAGARAVLSYEVTDRHGEPHGKDGIEENIRFHETNAEPLVRSMMGAHASFTLGPSTLEALVGSARDHGLPIHIHLAEDELDQTDSRTRYAAGVVDRLQRAGALREDDLVAHGIHLDADERLALIDRRVWIAHNPRSNMNNSVGRAAAERMGERVVLGTDGIDGDMFAELAGAYFGGRSAATSVTCDWAVRRLTAGAAMTGRIFGEPLIGTLDPEAPADVIVIPYDPPTALDETNLAAHLVFGLGAASPRDVMVGGRWVIQDGRHVGLDEEELAHRCRAAAPKLWARMQEKRGATHAGPGHAHR